MITTRTTKEGRRYDVRLRDPAGRVYTRTFRTKKEAELFEARERADRSRGAWVDPRQGTLTLAEWSERWMTEHVGLGLRTRELYQGLLDRQILPALGGVVLGKLSPSSVRAWYSGLVRPGGPGASTAAKAYRLLRAIMQTAVADELMYRNPCQLKGAGVERAPERPVATVAQVEALADAITPRFRVLVLLAAWCGMRRGELLGLQRRDLDLLHGAVRIERSLNQLRDGTLVIGPPKTEAGRRTVAIPPHVQADVASHLDRFVAASSEALVFTGEKGGPVRPHVLQKAWVEARTAVRLPHLHLHDLRHAGNTWAAATGASTKELMSRMGHASSDAALRYQHATSDRDQAIARSLSGLAHPTDVVEIATRTRDGRAMTAR
jgi:integrase